MLNVARHRHPIVHRLFPDRPNRSLKGGICYCTNRNPDHRRVFASPRVDGRSALNTKERLKAIALVRRSLKPPALADDRELVCRIIGKDGKR